MPRLKWIRKNQSIQFVKITSQSFKTMSANIYSKLHGETHSLLQVGGQVNYTYSSWQERESHVTCICMQHTICSSEATHWDSSNYIAFTYEINYTTTVIYSNGMSTVSKLRNFKSSNYFDHPKVSFDMLNKILRILQCRINLHIHFRYKLWIIIKYSNHYS